MQYQFLQTNITRAVWQTGRRITNEILGVKSLIIIAYSQGAIIWNGFFIIAAITKLVELLSALLSALLLFHWVLDLWFVLREAVAICIRLVSLLHFVMKSNKKMVVTHAPLPLLSQASCQLLCVEIYIMRVEYRNLSVSTIKHNDVIRALKQKPIT